MTEREQYLDMCKQLELKADPMLYILFCAAWDRGSRAGRDAGYQIGYDIGYDQGGADEAQCHGAYDKGHKDGCDHTDDVWSR